MSELTPREIAWMQQIKDLDDASFLSLPLQDRQNYGSLMYRYRQRSLTKAMKSLKERYASDDRIEWIWLSGGEQENIGCTVFFTTKESLETSLLDGFRVELESTIRYELEQAGRGKARDLNLNVDWESDERIQKDFGGNYLKFFR